MSVTKPSLVPLVKIDSALKQLSRQRMAMTSCRRELRKIEHQLFRLARHKRNRQNRPVAMVSRAS